MATPRDDGANLPNVLWPHCGTNLNRASRGRSAGRGEKDCRYLETARAQPPSDVGSATRRGGSRRISASCRSCCADLSVVPDRQHSPRSVVLALTVFNGFSLFWFRLGSESLRTRLFRPCFPLPWFTSRSQEIRPLKWRPLCDPRSVPMNQILPVAGSFRHANLATIPN
jgi:hypothetical protein